MVNVKNNQLKTKLFQECFENEYGFYTQPISTSDSNKILFANAYGKTKEECLANAKLIAAAPEMLEALINIEDYVNRSLTLSGHSSKDIEIILSKVRISVKKATE